MIKVSSFVVNAFHRQLAPSSKAELTLDRDWINGMHGALEWRHILSAAHRLLDYLSGSSSKSFFLIRFEKR